MNYLCQHEVLGVAITWPLCGWYSKNSCVASNPGVCKRKEKEISAKIHLLRNKSLDLFDQFVSMAEREIDIIWYGLL